MNCKMHQEKDSCCTRHYFSLQRTVNKQPTQQSLPMIETERWCDNGEVNQNSWKVHAEQRNTILVLLAVVVVDWPYLWGAKRYSNARCIHNSCEYFSSECTTVETTCIIGKWGIHNCCANCTKVATTVEDTLVVGVMVLRDRLAAIADVVTTVVNTWCAGSTTAMSKISWCGKGDTCKCFFFNIININELTI